MKKEEQIIKKGMVLYQVMELQILRSKNQLKLYKLKLYEATGNFPVPLDRDVDLPMWIPEEGQKKKDAKKTYLKSRPSKKVKKAIVQMRHLIAVLEDEIQELEALFFTHKCQFLWNLPPVHGRTGGKSLKTKNIRSATPRGFAKAVFLANSH
jgi:hypothetical protein